MIIIQTIIPSEKESETHPIDTVHHSTVGVKTLDPLIPYPYGRL